MRFFFDGTANNKTNVKARFDYLNKQKNNKKTDSEADKAYEEFEDDNSYKNGYTNIVQLEKYINDASTDVYDYLYPLYIEGCGTEDLEADPTFTGQALGVGASGVEGKVNNAIREIGKCFDDEKIQKENTIWEISIDLFGFSRGATSARHFVSRLVNGEDTLLTFKLYWRHRSDYPTFEINSKIKIGFVGIYDTVASHGIIHWNDTLELGLAAIKNAERVVHLTAADEHRVNFSLVDIRGALKKGIGTQIFLPGVHADVGGGYNETEDEVGDPLENNPSKTDGRLINYKKIAPPVYMAPGGSYDQANYEASIKAAQVALQKDKEFLIREGWYKRDEFLQDAFDKCELRVKRIGIKNDYSKIPLKLMSEYASSEADLCFKPELEEESKFSDDLESDNLEKVEGLIRKYIDKCGDDKSKPEDWTMDAIEAQEDRRLIQWLRHNYVHFSAEYNTFGGLVNRATFKKGVRKRIIRRG